jgi:hypothetical protein
LLFKRVSRLGVGRASDAERQCKAKDAVREDDWVRRGREKNGEIGVTKRRSGGATKREG